MSSEKLEFKHRLSIALGAAKGSLTFFDLAMGVIKYKKLKIFKRVIIFEIFRSCVSAFAESTINAHEFQDG